VKKSFTLIELLIVLVIISILTTVSLPEYRSFINKARGSEAKKVLRALADAIAYYYEEANGFPTSAGGVLDMSKMGCKDPISKYFTYGSAWSDWGGSGGVIPEVYADDIKSDSMKTGENTRYAIFIDTKARAPNFIAFIQSWYAPQKVQKQSVSNCIIMFYRIEKNNGEQWNWN